MNSVTSQKFLTPADDGFFVFPTSGKLSAIALRALETVSVERIESTGSVVRFYRATNSANCTPSFEAEVR